MRATVERIPIADSGAPIRNEQGDLLGVVLVFRDQTDERAAQRLALLRMRLIEHAAVNTLDEFLRKALDEIGTFLDSPIGFFHYNSLEHKKGMPEGHAEVVRELSVPVMREGIIVAVLSIGNKPVDYTEKDAENLASLADSMWEIVERKRAEEARREGDEINNAVINQATEGIVLVDSETLRFAEFNDEACSNLGYSREEFAGLTLFDVQGSMTREEFAERIRQVKDAGHGRFENRQKRKDGSLRDVIISNRVIDIRGRRYGVGVWLDITERKRMEEALRDSETRFRTILYTTSEGFWLIDNSAKTLDVNPRMCSILGREREEILGRQIYDFVDEENRAVFRRHMELRAAGVPSVYEIALSRPDGSHVFCRFSATPISEGAGGGTGSFAMVTDITERKQAEMELLRAKTEWERTFDSVPDMVCIIDTSYRIVRANKAMAKRFGLTPEQLAGMECRQMIRDGDLHPEFRPLASLLADSREHSAEVHDERIGADLEIRVTPLLDDNGVLVGAVHIARDVTAQIALEKQSRQTQKMEALGALAGGIAHDFNNILAIIMGYADMALRDLPEQSSVHTALQNVLKASSRAKDLVRQILAFSRKSAQERKPVEIVLIVREALKLLRASIPATVRIHEDLDCEGVMMADPSEIQQVVMNLCANASHAMREEGGVLRVSLDKVSIGADQLPEHPGLQPGPHLRLSVSDTGPGIEPRLIERIFEPYFTTKGPGDGTGMGLAIVHGIAKSLGGTVEVFSRDGRGATFRVFFPLITLEPEQTENISRTELQQGNKERILFVDDEQAIAELAELMLARLGYQVTVATSSLKALELFRAAPDMFDLLISDQTMPNLTGVDLAREIHQIRPHFPVILCTGYSERLTEEGIKQLGINALVMKPVDLEHLAAMIRKSLAGN